MVTLHITKKETVHLSLEQFKELEKLIKWNKVYAAIDPSSIDVDFMKTFSDLLDKNCMTSAFIKKSTNIEVIKMYNRFVNKNGAICLDYNYQASEEFIKYWKDKICNYTYLKYQFTHISESLLEEVLPYANAQDYFIDGVCLYYLIVHNPNISYNFIKLHETDIIRSTYIQEYTKLKKNSYINYTVPSINFLKFYKNETDWETLLIKAPLKVFTKEFVVEFYDIIAPLCISIPNIDSRKVNKVSQYRKYVKKG